MSGRRHMLAMAVAVAVTVAMAVATVTVGVMAVPMAAMVLVTFRLVGKLAQAAKGTGQLC